MRKDSMSHEDKLNIIIWFGILGLLILTVLAVKYREIHKAPQPAPKVEIEVVFQATESVKSVTGVASYYRYGIREWTNENALVCAVRDFPRYTWVMVQYKGNFIACYVTDYGPDPVLHPDRVIDLSPRVMKALAEGGLKQGLLKNVKVEEL